MERSQGFHGFDFYDNCILDDDIQSIAGVEGGAAIFDGKRGLAHDGKAQRIQLICQTMFIRGFEKTWSQCLVDR